MSKRKRPDSMSGLNEDEKKVLGMIRSKEGMGATNYEMKTVTKMLPPSIKRVTDTLKKKNLIKEIPSMTNKGIKHFIAVEFEPSKDLTGGDWYQDGALNLQKIEDSKGICVAIIERQKKHNKVTSLEKLCEYFDKTQTLNREQVRVILKNLVLENVIMELKSNGLDECSETSIGQVCYKLTGKKSDNGEGRAGAFASVPCGACPHIGICSPGGAISPTTCDYFQKWLDF